MIKGKMFDDAIGSVKAFLEGLKDEADNKLFRVVYFARDLKSGLRLAKNSTGVAYFILVSESQADEIHLESSSYKGSIFIPTPSAVSNYDQYIVIARKMNYVTDALSIGKGLIPSLAVADDSYECQILEGPDYDEDYETGNDVSGMFLRFRISDVERIFRRPLSGYEF